MFYYCIIVCGLLFLQSCGESTHPDLKLFQLKGRVKSLSYDIVSDKKDYYRGGALDIYYGESYDYEFSKEGEWINPKEIVDRNSDGYITKLGYREITWDSKGRLLKRLDCDSDSEDEPCSGIEYYYKDENVVDSLYEMQPGADAEIIHRYRCEDFDEYGNWTYAKAEIVDISRENMNLGNYTIIRRIKYWSEEELNEGKKNTSSKNLTAAFNDAIKNRNLMFRLPFNGEYYKCLLFYPITETKGHVYLMSYESDMNRFAKAYSYRFTYSISNDEIFMTNGLSIVKRFNPFGSDDYARFEDTVLKITRNSKNIELQVMPNGSKHVEYIWNINLDDFRKQKLD